MEPLLLSLPLCRDADYKQKQKSKDLFLPSLTSGSAKAEGRKKKYPTSGIWRASWQRIISSPGQLGVMI